jgi:hypothetical protein
MNWRRGVLLAGIHLAVAGSLMAWQGVRERSYLISSKPQPKTGTHGMVGQDEQTLQFDPCGFWRSIPPQEIIVQSAELPAAVLSGWGGECPSSGTLYGMLHQGSLKNTQRERVIVAAVFCALILVQWLLIGGLPLIEPRRWWWEPGAFITVCTLLSLPIVLIPVVRNLSLLFALFAGVAWLYWFALLLWVSFRSGWRSVRRNRGQEP